jgi:uncharacterized protein (DUF2147 family)
MKLSKNLFLVFLLTFSLGFTLSAQTSFEGKSATGTWRTVDDETGKARSHVKIWEDNGKYFGKIEQLLNRAADEDQDPICTVCPADRKNKKVIGMTIVRGMKKESSRYGGGKILDPKKGTEYDCTMWLTDKNTLKVRGWWGPVYRTQTWHRIN